MVYSVETLGKYVRNMAGLIRNYRDMIEQGAHITVTISKGNKKIGHCMNVSTAPLFTCGGNCKHCMHVCYDVKANIQYGNVRNARAKNTAMSKYARVEYFRQIDIALYARKKNKFFRWHVAGDIIDYDYLCRMIDIAIRHADFVFWTYTKQYVIVNTYVMNNGNDRRIAIPSNLSIMFSIWDGLYCDNRYNFPEFNVIMKANTEQEKQDKKAKCPHHCPGNCNACLQGKTGCPYGVSSWVDEH